MRKSKIKKRLKNIVKGFRIKELKNKPWDLSGRKKISNMRQMDRLMNKNEFRRMMNFRDRPSE